MRCILIVVCLLLLEGFVGPTLIGHVSIEVSQVLAPVPKWESITLPRQTELPAAQAQPTFAASAYGVPIPASRGRSRVQFGPREDRGLIEAHSINEASGLVASRRNREVLWTHNDSGDGSHLYALDTRGRDLGVYTLAGIKPRDWEDIAIGPGPQPGQDYIYVADIGDNRARNDLKYIYRVLEPTVNTAKSRVEKTLQGTKRITFYYPQGNVDAETLLSDPLNGDLYVIAKRSTTVMVYRAPFPQSTSRVIMLEPVTTLTFNTVLGLGQSGQGAVGGDIALSGLEILVKTYGEVLYWSRDSGEEPLFAAAPLQVHYLLEPQGEAIAWAIDGNGYYTVSEERQGIPARLYFYPRH